MPCFSASNFTEFQSFSTLLIEWNLELGGYRHPKLRTSMPESNHANSSYQVLWPVRLRHCPFASQNRSDDLIRWIFMLWLKHGLSKFQMSASTDFEILLNEYCWKWSYELLNSVQLLAEKHGTNISWQYLSPIVKKSFWLVYERSERCMSTQFP